MSSISAGTTSSTALVATADTSGALVLQTNNGTTALTLDTSQNATFAGYANLPNTFGFKNRIINGAMVIDQRNAGASVTPAGGSYTLDRWLYDGTNASKVSVQQNAGSVTPPAGFTNYLGVTSLSAYVLTGNESYSIQQRLEGFNTADFNFGKASATNLTLSFWVRSSLTGTFGGQIFGNPTRAYPFTYSIPTANTWTYITIAISGDTTVNTYNTTNSFSLILVFGLGASGTSTGGTVNTWQNGNFTQPAGTVSVVSTNAATWYVTGVQLEKGSTATSFDYRDYGTELFLCQRYYETTSYPSATQDITSTKTTIVWNAAYATGERFLVAKRTTPTVTVYGRTGVAGSPTSAATGAAIGGTSTATSINATGYWALALGAAQTAYVTVVEVGYTAAAEL